VKGNHSGATEVHEVNIPGRHPISGMNAIYHQFMLIKSSFPFKRIERASSVPRKFSIILAEIHQQVREESWYSCLYPGFIPALCSTGKYFSLDNLLYALPGSYAPGVA
jgi:hypothetical protein